MYHVALQKDRSPSPGRSCRGLADAAPFHFRSPDRLQEPVVKSVKQVIASPDLYRLLVSRLPANSGFEAPDKVVLVPGADSTETPLELLGAKSPRLAGLVRCLASHSRVQEARHAKRARLDISHALSATERVLLRLFPKGSCPCTAPQVGRRFSCRGTGWHKLLPLAWMQPMHNRRSTRHLDATNTPMVHTKSLKRVPEHRRRVGAWPADTRQVTHEIFNVRAMLVCGVGQKCRFIGAGTQTV